MRVMKHHLLWRNNGSWHLWITESTNTKYFMWTTLPMTSSEDKTRSIPICILTLWCSFMRTTHLIHFLTGSAEFLVSSMPWCSTQNLGLTLQNPRWLSFCWFNGMVVILMDHFGGWKSKRLHQIGFIDGDNPFAFGFLDLAEVICGIHLILAFAYSQTSELLPPVRSCVPRINRTRIGSFTMSQCK